MRKANAYLADSLKGEVERRAGKRACSEAEVIRDAIGRPLPKPGTIPGDNSWADRVDDYLDGFGNR